MRLLLIKNIFQLAKYYHIFKLEPKKLKPWDPMGALALRSIMSPENKKILWSLILEAGDFLNNKLPESPKTSYWKKLICSCSPMEIKNKFQRFL